MVKTRVFVSTIEASGQATAASDQEKRFWCGGVWSVSCLVEISSLFLYAMRIEK